jgi:uncharacterized PurR-regulated membrane protein YhhQ (DUF165 family)
MSRALTPALLTLYLLSFISANLLVKHFGAYGLWFSSLFLIPFDFVIRCWFQEKYAIKFSALLLGMLVLIASIITYALNKKTLSIAMGSIIGFALGQFGATVLYQLVKKSKSWFLKVNSSDLVAIVGDSCIFQLIAFSHINPIVTTGQILIKFIGGLFWFYILFKRVKIQRWLT